VIDGHDQPISMSRGVVGLLVAAIFEMFIMAIHNLFTAGIEDRWNIGTAVLGPVLAQQSGAKFNIMAMVLLWLTMGAALGAGLSLAIRPPAVPAAPDKHRRGDKGFGALIGLLTGAVGAPLAVVAYIFLSRLTAEAAWMLDKPEEWAQNVGNLYDRLPSFILVWPLKLAVGIAWQIGQHIHGPWGPVVAIVGVIAITAGLLAGTEEKDRNWIHYSAMAAPIVMLGAPLLGTSLSRDLRTVGTLFLLVAVVWGVPGLLLGTVVPYLRKPSENRKVWALVAWLTASALVLFVRLEGFYVVAGLLALSGFAFWKGIPIDEYWPIMALCLAAFVLTVTRISQSANFFYIQDLSRVLVSEPLARVSPKANPDPEWASLEASLQRFSHQANFTTVEAWMAAANTRLDVGNRLLAATAPVSSQLSKQAEEDGQLTAQLSGPGMKGLKEVTKALSLRDTKLEDARKQVDSLVSEQKACRELLGRVLSRYELSPHFDPNQSLEPTAAEKMKRQDIEALIGSLAAREQELRAGWALRDDAEQKLQGKLLDLNGELAQRFELCLNGSLGFWIPMGLLAGWARVRGSAEHEQIR